MIKLLNLLLDQESFVKPDSTKIRDEIIQDILRVDPEKWFHPNLPNGQTSPYWGTVECSKDGEIKKFKCGDVDLSIYEHPDLDYRLIDVPLATYKEGEYDNLTKKDRIIIRSVLYDTIRGFETYTSPISLLLSKFDVGLFIVTIINLMIYSYLIEKYLTNF